MGERGLAVVADSDEDADGEVALCGAQAEVEVEAGVGEGGSFCIFGRVGDRRCGNLDLG